MIGGGEIGYHRRRKMLSAAWWRQSQGWPVQGSKPGISAFFRCQGMQCGFSFD
jgi:hypothetical protein